MALLFSCVLSPLSARVGYPPLSLSLLSSSAFSLSLSLACTAYLREGNRTDPMDLRDFYCRGFCCRPAGFKEIIVVNFVVALQVFLVVLGCYLQGFLYQCLYGMLLSVPLALVGIIVLESDQGVQCVCVCAGP